MCTRTSTRTFVLSLAFLVLALHAARATAEPIAVSGYLFGGVGGAQIQQELNLAFPDFRINIAVQPRLSPGFCLGCGDGAAVPFTQSTGAFSGHSTALPGAGTIDADVTGLLSFVGPTEFVSIGSGVGVDVLTSPVQVSGFLRITQPNRVLFDGTLVGAGIASVTYENRFPVGDTRLAGYLFEINGVAATPEPASFLLVGTGVAWVVSRRRTGRGRRSKIG